MKKTGLNNLPLDLTILSANINQELSDVDTRYAIRQLSKHQFTSRNDQAMALYDVLRNEMDINVSIRRVSRYNLVDPSKLSKLLRNPNRKKWDRSPKLTPEQELEVLDWLSNCYNNNNPQTPRDLRNEILNRFDVFVTKNWFRYLMKKYPNKLVIATAHPQDDKRLSVTKNTAKEHISNLLNYVNGIPTELILNLDEASSSDWEDRRSKKVIVPEYAKDRRIEFEVSRATKKITICSTISMAGDVLPPLIVSRRKTIDDDVYNAGWREGQDFVYAYQERGFINSKIFNNYIYEHVIPYIKNTRTSMKIEKSPAVLLIDNCPLHTNEELYRRLALENIRVITFPPHTTNLFQPLDLVTFHVYKQEKSNMRSKYKKGSQIDLFYRNLVSMEKATHSSNNRNAFYCAGLSIQTSVIPHVASIRVEYLNEVIDESNLSNDERINNMIEFGWVNKKYFQEFQ